VGMMFATLLQLAGNNNKDMLSWSKFNEKSKLI
jgi:hypothetical protein